MSKSPILLVLVGASALIARSQIPPRINGSAVWHMPGGFVANAQTACGSSSASQFGDCLIQQMVKAGASTASVSFTRELFQQSHEVGVMTSFQAANAGRYCLGYLFVASQSSVWTPTTERPAGIVNVEDLKLLDRKSMQQSFQYKDLQKQFAKLDIFPGDRDGKTWPESQPGPNGGAQFVLNYPLRNGCATCANAGSVIFTWNFDKDGKFLGTSFTGMIAPPLN